MIGRGVPPSTQEPDRPRGFDDYDLLLGDMLRGERATKGKSLLDVQRELKIKATYIVAIENCDAGAFETPGFVSGYVRSYARYLGLDPEWTFRRFCEESGFTPPKGMVAAGVRTPSAGSERRLRKHADGIDPLARAGFIPQRESIFSRIEPGALGSMAVMIALIGALGYGGWAVLQEVQRVQVAPADQTPGVAVTLDPLGEISLPEQSGTGLAAANSDALDRLYRPQALDVPVMTARDGPISAINPRDGGTMATAGGDPAALDAAARDRIAELVASASGAQANPVQVVEAGPPSVEILAVRPAWIRVQSADGTVLFERILDAGERYEVPQSEEPARLRAGNSGSVYFVVNGEAFGPSAPGANVASNVNLAAEALRESYQVADLNADPELASLISVAEAGN